MDRRKRVNTWMYLHREEIGLGIVPIGIVKYCSQAFDDINTGRFGYDVAQRWGGNSITEVIRDFNNKLDTNNQLIFETDTVHDMIKKYSGVDFVIAEMRIEDPSVDKNGTIMNLAVHWNTNDKLLRQILSDALTGYVASTTGYLRPDYSNDGGWDTFESE